MTALIVASDGVPATASGGDDPPEFSWEVLDSGTEALLSGLDGVSADVAWIASVDGVVLRTVDGGATFSDVSPPDSADVNFLDVEASSADDALLLAVGPSGAGVYRTSDGGANWAVTHNSTEDFFNCMAMFDRRHGFAFGDQIDGKFRVIVTSDAGRSWELIDPAGMPDALPDEAGLAFAGNCAAATGRKAFFGTGFASSARVFRSSDRGLTWEVSSTPMECCIAGLDFRTNRLGIAVVDDVARTTDGGVTWQLLDEAVAPPPSAYDVGWWSDLRGDDRSEITDAQRTVFMAGGEGETEGSWVSRDRGKTWEQFSDLRFASIECVEDSLACWASGSGGRILKLVVS